MNKIFETILKEELLFLTKEIENNNLVIKGCIEEGGNLLGLEVASRKEKNLEFIEIRNIILKKINGDRLTDNEGKIFNEKFSNIQKKLKKSLKLGKDT